MKRSDEITRRDLLQRTGLIAAGAGLWSETLFQDLATADEKKPWRRPPRSGGERSSRDWTG